MDYQTAKRLLPPEKGTQLNARFLEKASRDAELLRRHARFVIVLDRTDHGVACTETIDNTETGYIANIIAVLAPVELFEGAVTLSEGLVLEVGLSRGRPYQQAEAHLLQGERPLVIKGRRRLRSIEFAELRVAWPEIARMLSEATERLQSGRKERNAYTLPGRDYIHEAGMRVSIAREDELCYWKVIIEDERARTRRYLKDRAEWIASQLAPYAKTRVTGKRFKQLKGVVRVADALYNMRKYSFAPNYLMRTLLRLIPKSAHSVFRETLEAHDLGKLLAALDRDPKMPEPYTQAKRLPSLRGAYLLIVRKQGAELRRSERYRRKRQISTSGNSAPHAQGCVVAEHFFEERRR